MDDDFDQLADDAISTVPDPTFEARRKAYYNRVLAQTASDEGRKAYFRSEYKGQASSVFAEYLDWLDELEYHDTWASDSVKSFTYHLAEHFVQFECGDHTHRLVPIHAKIEARIGDIKVAADSDIPVAGCCWASTIRNAIWRAKPRWRESAILPAINTEVMAKFEEYGVTPSDDPDLKYEKATTSGASQEGNPPPPVTFQTFRNVWFSAHSARAGKLALATDPSIKCAFEAHQVPALPRKVLKQQQFDTPKVRHSTGRVVVDHGLHAMMMYHPSPGIVLAMINRSRLTCGIEFRITLGTIERAMSTCPSCKRERPPVGVSPVGIYYAPPGAGKTTCLDSEYIVAVDTDWLAEYPSSDFHKTIAQFLYHGIPIITNQHSVGVDAGIKVCGLYCQKQLRINPETGHPYAERSRLISIERAHHPDLQILFLHNRTFMSAAMLSIFFMNYTAWFSQWRYFGRESVHYSYHRTKQIPRRKSWREIEDDVRRYPLPLTESVEQKVSGKPRPEKHHK